ncbi:MAG: type II toxin-antitoxin system PemK/MazF family toxin [Elusimicrobiota bacterium]|nr:type II toxin-antitoxin system PemK/MazF family toxin [Elusimicrobiota bacterium]
MRRGEIWWANLPKPVGRRPVVLLSRDAAYSVRNAATIAEITSTIRDIPVEVLLGPDEGLPKKCVVNLDTLMTIRQKRLDTKICVLSKNKMEDINEAIKFALNLP